MIITIKRIEEGEIPARATHGSAGFDCYSRVRLQVAPRTAVRIPLGFALAIPEGYHGQIRPRSGLATKGIATTLGTIDSDYRGEVCAILWNLTGETFVVEKRMRVCQLVIERHYVPDFVEGELDETERGEGGFGSTGLGGSDEVLHSNR